MKTEIADSDLISARKAAIAFSEDAEHWKKVAEYAKALWLKTQSQQPFFLVVGIMIGVLSVLIVASL